MLDALQSRACAPVVEDLHWGDEATLDLVRFLARRIGTLPLLLVLSYREAGGAAHPLRAVLGDLVGAPDARRLQLTPLSRAAVAELLDGHRLDPVDVHARTAGTRSSSARSSPSRTRRCRKACATPWWPERRDSHRRSGARWSCCPARPTG